MKFDLAIVGGGASGLFCAVEAAENGLSVLVVERRERPARKLLITGKGRCNLCNLCDRDTFMRNIPRGARFLQSSFSLFPPESVMDWFEQHGVPLKVERGNRVFPVSDNAMDVVDALVKAANQSRVKISQGRVSALFQDNNTVYGIQTSDDQVYRAKNVIIATGGKSYPATGSTGDGYRLAESIGHMVTSPSPSLVPLITREKFVQELEGLSLRNVELSLWDSRLPAKPVYRELGEMLFTDKGISGPLCLTASSMLDPERPQEFFVTIDLKPGLPLNKLNERMLRDFSEQKNRDFENALSQLLPRSLQPVIVRLSGIPLGTKVHSVTREQRLACCKLIKALPLKIGQLGSFEEAVITRGGVSLREVDPKTMRSKKDGNVYFIGEVLDADGFTGGFNLQIAFSTAYAAAHACIDRKYKENGGIL